MITHYERVLMVDKLTVFLAGLVIVLVPARIFQTLLLVIRYSHG
jgi:hypothetical protein